MNGFSVYYVTGLNALRHKLKELLILHQIAKLAPAIIWKENCILKLYKSKFMFSIDMVRIAFNSDLL